MALKKIAVLVLFVFAVTVCSPGVFAQTNSSGNGSSSSGSSSRSSGSSSSGSSSGSGSSRSSNSNSGSGSSGSSDYSSTTTESLQFSPIPGGVLVDAKGVLNRNTVLDYGIVTSRQLQAAKSSYGQLPQDVAVKSALRFVSLNRLEKAAVAAGKLSEEMKYLAGLQRIEYIFYFEESKDIVIAGPAEGWIPGYEGAMVGQTTLQPVCELQDFVAALRAYAPQTDGADRVGCSIDPTPEGNVRMQKFQQEFGPVTARSRFDDFVEGLKESLGDQAVRVDGISDKTHAAQVLVSADYRMKRIGLGIDTAPVRMNTFIRKTTPAIGNALFRWYFVPDYDSVVITEDRNGLALASRRVKLIAENELNGSGRKVRANAASLAYTQSFTRNYPQIAERVLVFAQLRNFIDMLVAAEFIRQQDFYTKAGWDMPYFGSESQYPIENFNAPKLVSPVVGYKKNQSTLMVPIGGGVEIDPETVLAEESQKDTNGAVAKVKNNVKINLPEGAWWWDEK